jgi:formylglycine-generating enzyme required for sulfatase activity
LIPTAQTAWDSVLSCNSLSTWTSTPGANEVRPINCTSWYEAYAFCIWDDGVLPTEAEWNYAAAGGNEQRVYPWSVPPTSTTIDCTFANYSPPSCSSGLSDVGSYRNGRGRYGQLDLAGNVWEWNLDYFDGAPPVTPCVDCAPLTAASERMLRGGSMTSDRNTVLSSYRNGDPPDNRSPSYGARCARPP